MADCPEGATIVSEHGGDLNGLCAEEFYSILTDYAEVEVEGGDGPGRKSEDEESEGDESEGSEPDGSESEGDKPEGGESEGDKPEGDKPEGNESEGNESEGDKPEGNESGGGQTGGGKIKLPEQTFGEVVDPKPEAGQAQDERKAEVETQWQVATCQAQQQDKMCGDGVSDAVREMIEEAGKAHQDWRGLLRRWMTERAKTLRSFVRPNRRYSGGDIIMPSLVSNGMGPLVVGVDTSYSISRDELESFFAELRLLVEEVEPSKVHVVYCHTAVWHHDTFEQGEPIEIPDEIRCGGTRFSPVFNLVEREGWDPAGVIYFTDLSRAIRSYGRRLTCHGARCPSERLSTSRRCAMRQEENDD